MFLLTRRTRQQLQQRVVNTEIRRRILVTGALGQIGSELCAQLRMRYGPQNVLATDVRPCPITRTTTEQTPYRYLDVRNKDAMMECAVEFNADWIIHNTSIMSAKGEQDPHVALDINLIGTRNALDVAKELHARIFIPSTIAVFGPNTPKVQTSDDAFLCPTTVYGITKVFTEQLGTYYFNKYNVDFRSLRYPGILSHRTVPGGGTTDYAIHMIRQAAIQPESVFICGLQPNEALPMMYMPDCLTSTIQILEAESNALASRRVYNITAMSFTPDELFKAIQPHAPKFTVQYKENHLQAIAQSWPDSIDDTNARKEWGWKEQYSLDATVKDMIENFWTI